MGACAGVALLVLPVGATGQTAQGPEPRDLLAIQEPRALELSPDGSQVLLETRKADPEENEYRRALWRLSTRDGAKARRLELPEGARSPRWGPEGERIAFLAPGDSGDALQVWVSGSNDAPSQVTRHASGVQSFRWSPTGRTLAFTTLGPAPEFESRTGQVDRGIEIDPESFVIYRLFGNQIFRDAQRRRELWLASLRDSASQRVSDTLSVEEFRWSPSGNQLAFSARPGANVRIVSSIFVHEVGEGRYRVVQRGRLGRPLALDGAVSFSSPFWSPSGDRLGFLRTDHTDRWSALGELGVYTFASGKVRYLTSAESQEFYGPEFHWLRQDTIFVENTSEARRGLFGISVADGSVTPLRVTDQFASDFSLSRNGSVAAWVGQSVGSPPEVYASERPFGSARKISNLNASHRDVWLPEAESVRWQAADGTEVQGWLLPPRDAPEGGKAPLLVVVHGGPGYAVTNRFHPYPAWLYPVQVFAARGYWVFLPNYRGTGSFGKDFREPAANDREPVTDILAGIDALVERRSVDENRIGIMGQSHGAWLGPMVVAERPKFAAASFAEGAGNYLSLYGQMPGWLNRNIHEHNVGASPYEATERYLELSPAFRESFTATTPTLLEFGQESLAVQGLEFATALWRHDTPLEFVIYPETGHNIAKPALHIDSMERNLRWFERWIPTGPRP